MRRTSGEHHKAVLTVPAYEAHAPSWLVGLVCFLTGAVVALASAQAVTGRRLASIEVRLSVIQELVSPK